MTALIKTIASYETTDGQKFHSLEDAQTHTRKSLYEAIHKQAMRDNPEFHALPKETLLAFLMAHGTRLAQVATNEFKPEPIAPATGGIFTRPTPVIVKAGDNPRVEAVAADALRTAMERVDENETRRVTAG